MRRSPLRRTGPLKRKRGLRKINVPRQTERRKQNFNAQAELCRTLPCCACGLDPWDEQPTHPHHWPTIGAGGKDSDASPLCHACHSVFHSECGNHLVFLDRYEVDVVEVARLLAEQIKEES